MMISVCYGTIRGDFPLLRLPGVHQFQRTLDSLNRQSVAGETELVVADGLYYDRPDWFKAHGGNSSVVGRQVYFRDHWQAAGFYSIPAQFNEATVWSTGDVILIVGDCSTFHGERLLEHLASTAMARGAAFVPVGRDTPDRGMIHSWWLPCVRRDVWEEIGGYEELFGGTRGTDDCDMLNRLQRVAPTALPVLTDDYYRRPDAEYVAEHFPVSWYDPRYIWRPYVVRCTRQIQAIANGRQRTNVPLTNVEFETLVRCPELSNGCCTGFPPGTACSYCDGSSGSYHGDSDGYVAWYRGLYPRAGVRERHQMVVGGSWRDVWKMNVPPTQAPHKGDVGSFKLDSWREQDLPLERP